MSTNANSIKVGNILDYKNGLFKVLKAEHTQPGKGGAYVQMELKEIITGQKLNERFRSSENLDVARVEDKEYQFLFDAGDMVTLMDLSNYEQIEVPRELFGEQAVYLTEGLEVTVEDYDDKLVGARVPERVELTVEETEPVVKGQTAASSNKPAILNNGLRVMVPPFISEGDVVIVYTPENSYLERKK